PRGGAPTPSPRRIARSCAPRSSRARSRAPSSSSSPPRARRAAAAGRRTRTVGTRTRPSRFSLRADSLLLAQRAPEVKLDEAHQVVVRELGQTGLRAALDHGVREGALGRDERVDALLDRAAADELVHEDVPLLPDPERAIGSLILDGGVPPAIE